MTRGVRWSLAGCLALIVLAGCGRSFFAEREPWRREAEVACLKSGAVKEGPAVVMQKAVSGPGACGADFPLRVGALGESAAMAFAQAMRPPGAIPGHPLVRAPATYPVVEPPPAIREDRPLSLTPALPYPPPSAQPSPHATPSRPSLRPLRPFVAGPAAVTPAATLACPMVSALDAWIAEGVQPAAARWFGQPVVEIRQISSYSCRGMNGNPNARISEHAFGNALDIAAFTLADGRQVTVKDGWRASPEEQGFLRDIHASACQRFATVLAPGSNVYHYDHIHVDLMRRASGQAICNPEPISGEAVAARARSRVASKPRWSLAGAAQDASITGSLGDAIARALARERYGEPRSDWPAATPGID